MKKIRPSRPNFKISKTLIFLAVLVIVLAAFIFHNQQSKNPSSQQLVKNVDRYIAEGNCQKGLKNFGTINLKKYDSETRAKALDYLMQCSLIERKFDQALSYADKLKAVYISQKNNEQASRTEQAISQ